MALADYPRYIANLFRTLPRWRCLRRCPLSDFYTKQ